MEEITINAESNAKKLIFVFHGYGADKENVFPIGKVFSNRIADSEVHIPNGIDICDSGYGRQWFTLDGDSADLIKKAFSDNKPAIENYIIETSKAANIDHSNVILTGFSQGGIIAITLGLSIGVGAIVSFSGLYLESEMSIKNKNTKVLMTHGDADPQIPIDSMYTTEDYLNRNNINVKTIVSQGVAHAIDDRALIGAIDFLNNI